jgi:hypothetical protein
MLDDELRTQGGYPPYSFSSSWVDIEITGFEDLKFL